MRHVLILVLVLAGAQANAGLKLKQRVAKIYIDKNGKQISPIDAHRIALNTEDPVLECQPMEMEADEFTGKLKLKKAK